MDRTGSLLGLVIVVVLATVLLASCSGSSPEQSAEVETNPDRSSVSQTVRETTIDRPAGNESNVVVVEPSINAPASFETTLGPGEAGSQPLVTAASAVSSTQQETPTSAAPTATTAKVPTSAKPATAKPVATKPATKATPAPTRPATKATPAPTKPTTTTSPPINKLSNRGPIALPADRQPATPEVSGIGSFVPMPGTGGAIEFARFSNGEDGTRHHYARRSAIDPFNTYIILQDFLYELKTFQPITKVPFGYEYVVSQKSKHEFFGFVGNKLSRWNASTDSITEIWAAPSGSEYTIGQWEGEQSWDDRYIPVVWKDGGSQQLAIVDIAAGRPVGQMNVESAGSGFNWADISPLGTYVLIGNSDGVFRYNIDLTNKTKLNTTSSGNAHGDVLFDVAGNEVFAQEGHFYDGDISYTTLKSNVLHRMNVVDASTQSGVKYPNAASHISGQARDVQGRLFVSLQDTSGMASMFTVDLVPGQTKVQSWGHSHTSGDSYASEAKATISNDGKTIVWSSNLMGGTTNEYLARLK